jgi:FKBP-type peptidyl-prolyl cis-trans isomerase
MLTKRLLKSCVPMAVLAAGVSACGSSNKVNGIVLAPSAGDTTPTITATTTTSTSTTSTATTPKSGPLSKKPVVGKFTGAPPKKLVIKDLIKGKGALAAPGSTVTVNYVGVLYKNSKEFDSSWKRNMPFSTPLSNGAVITGWVKGIPGMRVGGRRELIIPANEAYGSASQPGIPANSTLVFVVDLLSAS